MGDCDWIIFDGEFKSWNVPLKRTNNRQEPLTELLTWIVQKILDENLSQRVRAFDVYIKSKASTAHVVTSNKVIMYFSCAALLIAATAAVSNAAPARNTQDVAGVLNWKSSSSQSESTMSPSTHRTSAQFASAFLPPPEKRSSPSTDSNGWTIYTDASIFGDLTVRDAPATEKPSTDSNGWTMYTDASQFTYTLY